MVSTTSLSTVLFVDALVHRKPNGDHRDYPSQDIDHDTSASQTILARVNQTHTLSEWGRLDLASSPHRCPNGHSIEANQQKYLTCPPGHYLDHQNHGRRENQNKRLLKALCLAESWGWENGNARETQFYRTRGYATFESSIWPKDKACKQLPDENWKHKKYVYRVDEPPQYMTKLVNNKNGIEFHKIWKVASSSFPTYLNCTLGHHWESLPVNSATPKETKVVTAVRNPIDRWISAMGELLERAINHICPSHPCGDKDAFDPSKTLPDLHHTTTWYKLVERGYNKAQLEDLVEAFVHDTQCNLQYYSAEHFTSQASFMTQNNGAAHEQSLIMKLEDIDNALKKFHELFGGNSHCKLHHSNSEAAKAEAHEIPDHMDILHTLRSHDQLMRQLCMVYAQDFICLDYELPKACQGMF